MKPEEEQRREHDIAIVLQERDALTRAAQSLMPILKRFDDAALDGKSTEFDLTDADKYSIEISGRLGNISGFCDDWTKKRIHKMQEYLGHCLGDSSGYILLSNLLPFMVGIQVNFDKRPFRAVGLSFEALGGKFKAAFER